MMLRWSLRWPLRLVLLLLALVVGALSWFTPLSTGYARIEPGELGPYVDSLRRHGAPPVEYVVSRFADHPVVIVGEHHRVAQEVEFVQDLIPAVYRRAGVRRLLIEFGVKTDQADVDRLLAAPEFDRALAKRLLANLGLFWLYEEYLGLYEAAWELNRTLAPGQPPFRILLACPPRELAGEKDAWMARAVLEEVERGEKVLVHCGSHHGFTRYQQPLPFLDLLPGARRSVRMGNFLSQALGERAFYVHLHGPVAKRWAFFAWLAYRRPMLFPFGGVIDRAWGAYGVPVGFDTSVEPFAALEDTTSYYSLHRDGLTLSGFADGYVVLAGVAERRAVRPFTDLGTEEDLAFLRKRHPDPSLADRLVDREALRTFVERDGLYPERAYALTDRSGFDEASWLPDVRTFWPLASIALAAWLGRRAHRRRRQRAPGPAPE